jgi:hypothetical protein
MKISNTGIVLLAICLIAGLAGCASKKTGRKNIEKSVTIGAYYYDGWSGKNKYAGDPDQPWAKNVSRQVTKRFVEEFAGREPVWGWRHDSQEIMERQIDLAADNGIDFFLFCWYWRDDKGSMNLEVIENMPQHVSLGLYLKAKNRHRIKFGFLIANHQGGEIVGDKNWSDAVKYLTKYFNDPQYVTTDGKPLVVIFNSDGVENETLFMMQDVAKAQGLKNGLSIAGCGSKAIGKSGFTLRTHYNVVPGYAAGSEEHKFAELVKATEDQWIGTEQQPYMPLITAGWDKRPWEGPNGNNVKGGWYFPDSTPELFGNFLKDAIQWMDDNPTKTTKERIMLIYAWNELGEGGYLVPTKGDPDAAKLKMIVTTQVP